MTSHPPPLPPLRFKPLLLDKVWGGERLTRYPGKGVVAGRKVGESWELSDIHGASTPIAGGPWDGQRLAQIATEDPEGLLGPGASPGTFPLLVKFIDASSWLSLQVHPGEGVARTTEGCPGKAEAWYVLEGGPLLVGLEDRKTVAQFREALFRGDDLPGPWVRRVQVAPGDVIPISPGIVHAIGEGVMLLEIQQPSDITYRLHDWGRTHRELHVDRALEVMEDGGPAMWPVPPLTWTLGDNLHRFHCGCRHFAVESVRWISPAPWVRAGTGPEGLTVLEGTLVFMDTQGRDVLHLSPGETGLLPASVPPLTARAEGDSPVESVRYYPVRLNRQHYDRLMAFGLHGGAITRRLFPA